jgi:hypothetical protein
MTASDPNANPGKGRGNELVSTHPKGNSLLKFLRPLGRLFPDAVGFAVGPLIIFLAGLLLIALYVYSEAGPHLRYLSVGVLTAFAAFLVGTLAGLVLAIPRAVSSGAFRYYASSRNTSPRLNQKRDDQSQSGAEPGPKGSSTKFEPSSNLAEISDWMTKLLLGAGLVSLTRLGGPLARLFDYVARGLGGATPSGKVAESAVVMAAGILITYVGVGFLSAYLTTTLWYGKRLEAAEE